MEKTLNVSGTLIVAIILNESLCLLLYPGCSVLWSEKLKISFFVSHTYNSDQMVFVHFPSLSSCCCGILVVGGGGGGIPGDSSWGCAAWFSKSWPYFWPKKAILHNHCSMQRKVVSSSLGQVDFPIRLVNFVLNLPTGKWRFVRKSNYIRTV